MYRALIITTFLALASLIHANEKTAIIISESPALEVNNKKYIIAAQDKADLIIASLIKEPTLDKIINSTGKPTLLEAGLKLTVLIELRDYFGLELTQVRLNENSPLFGFF